MFTLYSVIIIVACIIPTFLDVGNLNYKKTNVTNGQDTYTMSSSFLFRPVVIGRCALARYRYNTTVTGGADNIGSNRS
jgi:hypothetical protein